MATEHEGNESGAERVDASDPQIEVEDLDVEDGEEVKGGTDKGFDVLKLKPW
ncbi:MAG TPA: hypothetical protein VHX66_08170 [Solirubrobacteraceae bacterium]|jgi:hypothetical protein|nr:hypothetical protein [Solirubrobacteraceae bacterium]